LVCSLRRGGTTIERLTLSAIGDSVTEAHAEVVRNVIELIWNQGELDQASNFFDAEYVNHGGIVSDVPHGPEAIKVSVALLRTAFPALHVTIDVLTVDGDSVEVQWAATSVARRMLATGTGGRLVGTTRGTFANGKIRESWTEWDHAGVMRRLGIVPGGPDA
jgi:predicted ester cyclase